MKRIIVSTIASIFCLTTASVVLAQPKTLDELLSVVKRGAIAESKEYKDREREFQNAKQRQQGMLDDARRERNAEERRSEQLEATYTQQEEELARLTEKLNESLGALRELFGELQRVSGDTRGKFETSIISAQLPGRGEFLGNLAKKMGTSTELATIEEIERVVYELQREMTESGKVVTFKAEVIEPDGNKVNKDVIRVGSFNLISDGKYLVFDGDTQTLSELARQPASRLLSYAGDMSDASDGEVVRVAIDPSRGSILSLLVQAPSWFERATEQGGVVGWIIIFLGIIGILMALWRWVAVGSVARRVNAQIGSANASNDNPLGRILAVHEKNKSVDTETLELKLGEAILKETPGITKYISFLKIVAVVAPLLGLLGTVTGMILTFQAITLFGAGDPKLMAGGISQALVTTMLGLWVAIPMTLLHSFVNTRSKALIHILEEQSAGIVAAHNEKRK